MFFKNEFYPDSSAFSNSVFDEIIEFVNPKKGSFFIGIDQQNNMLPFSEPNDNFTKLNQSILNTVHTQSCFFIRFLIHNNHIYRIEISDSCDLSPIRSQVMNDYVENLDALNVNHSDNIKDFSFYPSNFKSKAFSDLLPSGNQNLSFNGLKSICIRNNKSFSFEVFPFSMMIRQDRYTNLGLLLSDQCPYTVTISFFNDSNCTDLLKNLIFNGSILKQYYDVITQLSQENNEFQWIHDLILQKDAGCSSDPFSEVLLNALIHRDYSIDSSIRIDINRDQLIVLSPGGLLYNLTKEDLFLGISQPRNKQLSAFFKDFQLVQNCGSGLRKIFRAFENQPVRPSIDISANAFKITLPGAISETKDKEDSILLKKTENDNSASITPQMQMLLDYLHQNPQISEDDLQTLLGIKRTRAYLVARQMLENGLIKKHGRGKVKYFTL